MSRFTHFFRNFFGRENADSANFFAFRMYGHASLPQDPIIQGILDEEGMPTKRKDQEKRIWEKMAASKTWAAMKRAFLSSAFAGKTGTDDLEFSPDESLKFSINKTKDDNKVKLKSISHDCA